MLSLSSSSRRTCCWTVVVVVFVGLVATTWLPAVSSSSSSSYYVKRRYCAEPSEEPYSVEYPSSSSSYDETPPPRLRPTSNSYHHVLPTQPEPSPWGEFEPQPEPTDSYYEEPTDSYYEEPTDSYYEEPTDSYYEEPPQPSSPEWGEPEPPPPSPTDSYYYEPSPEQPSPSWAEPEPTVTYRPPQPPPSQPSSPWGEPEQPTTTYQPPPPPQQQQQPSPWAEPEPSPLSSPAWTPVAKLPSAPTTPAYVSPTPPTALEPAPVPLVPPTPPPPSAAPVAATVPATSPPVHTSIASAQTSAKNDPAYAHDSTTAAVDHSTWMASVPGGVALSQMSLPGTHDSGSSVFGGDIALTQALPIKEQLKAGIRVLDIRLGQDHLNLHQDCLTDLWIFHGIACQKTLFSDVLNDVQSFLQSNTNEVIFMKIKKENGDMSIANFVVAVDAKMDAVPGLFYNGTEVDPILDDVRGKVVLVRQYSGSDRGIPYSEDYFKIQDDYELSTNWELAGKWKKVKQQLIAADANITDGFIYINFFSAAGGGFPYFFASGKLSSGDNAPALLTGYFDGCLGTGCTGGSNCLDEYPRTKCFLRCCSVAFDGINDMGRNYIVSSVTHRTGIVMMDFPGPGLIEAIIYLSLQLTSSST